MGTVWINETWLVLAWMITAIILFCVTPSRQTLIINLHFHFYISVPSAPENLTIVNNPFSPTILVTWDIHPRSLQDTAYVIACTPVKCPDKEFTLLKTVGHTKIPTHFNVSSQKLTAGKNYSFFVSVSNLGVKGPASVRAYLETSKYEYSFNCNNFPFPFWHHQTPEFTFFSKTCMQKPKTISVKVYAIRSGTGQVSMHKAEQDHIFRRNVPLNF